MSPDSGEDQTTARAGPLGRLRRVVDRSILLFLLRRLAGRRTDTTEALPFPAALSAEEVAFRIGADRGEARRPVVNPLIRPRAPTFAARRPFASAEASSQVTLRRQLARDTAVAIVGLAAVFALAVAVWPPAPRGGVLDAIATPEVADVVVPPSDEAAALVTEPSPVPTAEQPGSPAGSATASDQAIVGRPVAFL